MQTFSLFVRDMSCSVCSRAVKKELESVPDVCHVNVHLTEGSATVYYKVLNNVLEQILKQVNELGYLDRSQLVPHHQCSGKKQSYVTKVKMWFP